jgi:hypothetical protein
MDSLSCWGMSDNVYGWLGVLVMKLGRLRRELDLRGIDIISEESGFEVTSEVMLLGWSSTSVISRLSPYEGCEFHAYMITFMLTFDPSGGPVLRSTCDCLASMCLECWLHICMVYQAAPTPLIRA